MPGTLQKIIFVLSAKAKGWVLLKSAHEAEQYFAVYLLIKTNEFPFLKNRTTFMPISHSCSKQCFY